MARRLRPALVRGRPSRLWNHHDGHLILRAADLTDEFRVRIADLADQDLVLGYVLRLRDTPWAGQDAIDELRAMAAGART